MRRSSHLDPCVRLVASLSVAATAVATSLLGAGCEEITTFSIPAESEIEVPASSIIGSNPLLPDQVFPSAALSEALAQSIEQSFSTQDVDKDAVSSLKLSLMRMTVTEPDEGNRQVRGLGFLHKLTISVGNDAVAPVVVAQSDDGAFDGSPGPVSYEMPLTDAELQPALVGGDTLDMTADVEPGNPPNFATTVKFETELTVVVNVAGVLNGGP